MKTKVKTIWGAGFVSIHQKYVLKAVKNKEDLEVKLNNTTKKISLAELEKSKPRDAVYTDKFTGVEYKIYDFFWNKY